MAEAGVDDDGNGYVDDIHGLTLQMMMLIQLMDGHGTALGAVGAVHDNGEGVAGVMAMSVLLRLSF